ncbi:uroplakin-2-like [Carcharodon carcharias]|uniref:uroplakin-2-like n=1 Tax=Carcharodon carcharias TaxID=13397 RepID=UPI001B7E74FE|nr:uroplakin-2-like [Carcharodon carcharias]
MRLLILLALASIVGAFNITLVNESSSGIVGSVRSMSAIMSLPPCKFSRQDVTVSVTNSTGGPGPEQPSFKMPICRFKRELVSLVSNINGISQTLNLGYRIKNLKPNTGYNVVYHVGDQMSNSLSIITTSPIDFRNIDDGFTGRTGAMVVITVLLVIAMALLIILLIVSVVVRS